MKNNLPCAYLFTFSHSSARLSDMRVLGVILVAMLAGCASPRDGERSAHRWIGQFPGQFEAFAACLEAGASDRMVARTIRYEEARRADVIVSPPPYYAIADYQVAVTQVQADKVNVIFRHRTAMDFGQTEQHVRYLAGVCGKSL